MRLTRRGSTWYVSAYDPAGRRHILSTRCQDRRAAEVAGRRIERELAAGGQPSGTETLQAALARLVAHRESQAAAGQRSSGTASFYASKSRVLIANLGASLPLRALTPSMLAGYVDERTRAGAGAHTIHKELIALSAALKLAARAGTWSGNLDALIPEHSPAYKPRSRYLTREELSALLGQLRPDHAARVAFAVAAGATWSDTDRAQRADVNPDSTLVRGLKTATRWRSVPFVLDDQKSLAAYALEHAQGVGGLLFNPWGSARRDIRSACKRAGIPMCSPNDFRRTLATWLRMAGAPPDLIAPVMGHADSRMVERVYGRLPADFLASRLRACITGASAISSGEEKADPSASTVTTEESVERVPRAGIEPATRGFSVLSSRWTLPRQSKANRGSFK